MTDKELISIVDAKSKKLWDEINTGHEYSIIDSYNQFYGICMEIAEMVKKEPVSIWHDKVQKIREKVVEMVNSINPFIPDEDGKNSDYEAGKLDAATQVLQIIDSFEEPVSEKKCIFTKDNYTDEDRKTLCEDCKEKCEYSKKEEPVSEDLGEYINELSKQFPEVSFAKLSRIAVRVAKWQEKKDQSIIELAEDHAMLAGMEKMKEQLMSNATEVTVHIDAGNYPYTPEIELYDYDKDVPLAKEGDKYKVILIKEE